VRRPEKVAPEIVAPAYRVESLRAYDTLPQTAHVELIAKLVRRDDAGRI
jgi:hypothetical protein